MISGLAFQLKNEIDRRIIKLKIEIKSKEKVKHPAVPEVQVNDGFLNTDISKNFSKKHKMKQVSIIKVGILINIA